jgi:hypothetical protein
LTWYDILLENRADVNLKNKKLISKLSKYNTFINQENKEWIYY